MNITMFMTKKDWTAIFGASLMISLLLVLTLISKLVTWLFIALFVILAITSFYLAFIKKYDVEDRELESMIGSLKDDLFGGKK